MIAPIVHSGAPTLADSLMQRLQKMQLTPVWVSPNGEARAAQALGLPERAVVESRWFRHAVGARWEQIAGGEARVVPLWDGLWLAPLPVGRRRRAGVTRQPAWAVLLLGHALPRSEQFHAACDEHRIDHAAAAAQLDPDRLVTEAEAQRLATMLAWMVQDVQEVERQRADTRQLSCELADSYEELSLLYKLSTRITVDQSPSSFLNDACEELQTVVGLDWLAVQLVHDEPRLQDLAGRLFVAGAAASRCESLAQIGRDVFRRFEGEEEPRIFDDIGELNLPDLAQLSGDLLVVPLRCDAGTIGVLMGGGGGKRGDGQLTSGDSKLCASLAASITIFLQNRMLYEDVQSMFLGTLHALTSAIDAKDSYTHGHSERVALMSRLLAERMGLDAATVDRVYLSGLVHDVGKIGVPEAVLSKPGRLTAEEYDLIKLHPEIGARILRDIPQMQDLIPGVLHHHERWDGGGYPHRLRGEGIPLFGRIIGLADAFDAMSSDRTYHAARCLEEVLAEIRQCAGKQFDPGLAECFVGLDFGPYHRLIQKHQQGGQ